MVREGGKEKGMMEREKGENGEREGEMGKGEGREKGEGEKGEGEGRRTPPSGFSRMPDSAFRDTRNVTQDA